MTDKYNDEHLNNYKNEIKKRTDNISKLKDLFYKNNTTSAGTIQTNNSNDPYDEYIKNTLFDNTITKYEEMKKLLELEKQEREKNQKHKSEYTIVTSLMKVYYDLLMNYKGDIDTVFEDLLNEQAIDPEDEKPYIISSSYYKDIESNIDSIITAQLHSNHSHSFPTQSIGSHSHTINSSYINHIASTQFHNYIDDHSDYIDIKDYIFINNNHVLEHIINKGYWEYCSKECKQKLILNNYITDGYARYKDLHDVNFCVEYIQRNPKQEVICETHPEIMQTKEFQKYVKILKMKDEYQPY